MKFFKGVLLLVFFLPAFAFAQNLGVIRGVVKDTRSLSVIENATVQIVGQKYQTLTDAGGNFEFIEIPTGRVEIEISSLGYGKLILKEILLESAKTAYIEVFLESQDQVLDEVTVKIASPNLSGAVTSLKSINIEQVRRFPASFFDPARLVFVFPGVASTNDQANGMSIRGNNPNFLQWRLEGLETVNPNHLSNAGTFSDQPAANAGGTNMLSAQMLGNMNFLTGAFPAEYGNALSGIMDMRLRKGNNKEYEHTIQAGLIGVDLSSEGPISKKNGSSYLINYRYSFTGLLALGGLTFGGEAIKFQDLSINLSFPSKKLGDFTIFGIGGKNSNEFKFEDETGEGPQEEKDLSLINYYGKVGMLGATHQKKFSNINWKTSFVFSGLRTDRSQQLENTIVGGTNNLVNDFTEQYKIAAGTSAQVPINDKGFMKAGVFFTHLFDINVLISKDYSLGVQFNYLQPYVSWNQKLSDRTEFTLGVHNTNYFDLNVHSFEPRASFSQKVSKSGTINLALGRHSQILPTYYVSQNQPYFSNQAVLNYTQNIATNSVFTTEVFYQANSIKNQVPSLGLEYFDIFNVADPSTLRGLSLTPGMSSSRNYGVELAYQRYLDKGLFALINTTLYKSQSQNSNGDYFDTRFSGNHIVNVTIGKEFVTKKNRILGVNGRIVWMGGFRNYDIDLAASHAQKTTVFVYNQAPTDRNPDFFRPDLRVYYKKSKNGKTTTWSLDIQNVIGYQNVAFKYYDSFKSSVETKYQLGFIPLLNYRWEF